jgi:diguanylate cyclase (GGDEF)-like protein/putative nucleotidyltransferase with HDIG domain
MRFGGASLRAGVPDSVRSRNRFGHLASDAAASRVVSAVPGSVVLPEVPGPIDDHGRDQKPPLPATIYFFIIGVAAAAASIPLLTHLQAGTHSWATFIVLGSAAALAQLFVVRTPRNQSYHTTIVFLIPAVMLLPPELVVLIGVIQHVPEWLKNRNAWYSQTFNICNYTISLLAAWASFHATLGAAHLIPNADLRLALAGLAAAAVLVGVNHILLAPMLHFYYSHSIKELGIFSFESLSTDLVLAALGVGIGTFWDLNPWLLPFAVAPLLLIHRSLSVPQLQEEARVDPKTGLFNARYFAAALAEELARSQRFERPMTLIMADLDLLRDINNTYGHLAGDAVLKGIAETFRTQLRHYDVPARFGGEEFAILLPETPPEQAFEIAERIRRAVAASATDVETSSEPIRATVSIGVAAYPRDGVDANELIHQADLAVYRAKLQGRNRVLDASSEPLVVPETRSAPLVAVPDDGEHRVALPGSVDTYQADERRQARPHAVHGPTFFSLSKRLAAVVGSVGLVGIAAGVAGLVFGTSHDVSGLVAIIALVGAGQALALELDLGSISVSAVGAIAGAALFGPRAALALALTTAAVEWSARRQSLHHVLFNIGALSLASLAAVAAFSIHSFDIQGDPGRILTIVAGVAAGLAYFAVNMGLVSLATAVEGHERWLRAFQERFAWLVPHYLVYGFIAGVIFLGYESAHLWAFAVFAVPLFLMRKTQEAYLRHTQKSAQKLREAAETIQTQNVSLEQANRLLKERSTAAMESLSATVDARDAYTAGHSRRVQQLALAIGRELGLSQAELDLLGHAALFHDIGKLAVPDAILLKPASLTDAEWSLMQKHADEGARIIDRLGFLNDAVPAIRHHHERFDGAGYPDRLKGEEIPLGARIIHVADALDSMLTTRNYRAARPVRDALQELREAAGSQFCPRCVAALERILPVEEREPAPEREAEAVAL